MKFSLLFALLVFSTQPAAAIDHRFSGQIKTQSTHGWYESEAIAAVIGPDEQFQQDLEVRLMSEGSYESFQFVVHAESLGIAGNRYTENQQIAELIGRTYTPFQTDDRRLLDLSKEAFSGSDYSTVSRVDRMYVGYTEGPVAIRAGRQAITWGNGLFFQIMDLFNPFSPTEIDKDYKGGDDLLYAQYLYSSGNDTQLLIVPRRDPFENNITDDQSSFAVKHHMRAGTYEFDILLTQHYSDQIFGFGFSREVLGAIFRVDSTVTHLSNDTIYYSAVANIDRSWTLAGLNMYGLLEYFYNGFGVGEQDYLSPPVALQDRFFRAELFTAGRQYGAAGLRIELAPLVNLFLSALHNLRDSSGIAQVRLEWNVLNSVDIFTGLNLPYGSRGSEFGGLAISENSFLSPPRELYLRAGYYF